jgi:hypothetical protein
VTIAVDIRPCVRARPYFFATLVDRARGIVVTIDSNTPALPIGVAKLPPVAKCSVVAVVIPHAGGI